MRGEFWVLIGLIVVNVGAELTLLVAETAGFPTLRMRAYEYGGFWPGLLRDWAPNFSQQPFTMFVSYGFLHAGLVHLIVNMVTLWSLGRTVLDREGLLGFTVIYLGALVGAALAFGLIAPVQWPMVGASGALFGLVGSILAWNYIDRIFHRQKLWPVVRAIALLAALNLVMWWAMDGLLAWQAHLGGFVSGWVLALLVNSRPQS